MNGPEIEADRAEWREYTARVLHDAATGRITPDPDDPTPYGRMADAVLDEVLAGLLDQLVIDLKRRADERVASAGNGEQCDGDCPASDCHAVSAVATYSMTAARLQRRAAEIRAVTS